MNLPMKSIVKGALIKYTITGQGRWLCTLAPKVGAVVVVDNTCTRNMTIANRWVEC